MATAKKVYNAEVVLTVHSDSEQSFSNEELTIAAIEAEVRVNSLGYFDYGSDMLGLRLHLKGEKYGDDKDQNIA